MTAAAPPDTNPILAALGATQAEVLPHLERLADLRKALVDGLMADPYFEPGTEVRRRAEVASRSDRWPEHAARMAEVKAVRDQARAVLDGLMPVRPKRPWDGGGRLGSMGSSLLRRRDAEVEALDLAYLTDAEQDQARRLAGVVRPAHLMEQYDRALLLGDGRGAAVALHAARLAGLATGSAAGRRAVVSARERLHKVLERTDDRYRDLARARQLDAAAIGQTAEAVRELWSMADALAQPVDDPEALTEHVATEAAEPGQAVRVREQPTAYGRLRAMADAAG